MKTLLTILTVFFTVMFSNQTIASGHYKEAMDKLDEQLSRCMHTDKNLINDALERLHGLTGKHNTFINKTWGQYSKLHHSRGLMREAGLIEATQRDNPSATPEDISRHLNFLVENVHLKLTERYMTGMREFFIDIATDFASKSKKACLDEQLSVLTQAKLDIAQKIAAIKNRCERFYTELKELYGRIEAHNMEERDLVPSTSGQHRRLELQNCLPSANFIEVRDIWHGWLKLGMKTALRDGQDRWKKAYFRLHKEKYAKLKQRFQTQRREASQSNRPAFNPLIDLSERLIRMPKKQRTDRWARPEKMWAPTRYGWFERDYVDGMNRICVYDDSGSKRVITIDFEDSCPTER